MTERLEGTASPEWLEARETFMKAEAEAELRLNDPGACKDEDASKGDGTEQAAEPASRDRTEHQVDDQVEDAATDRPDLSAHFALAADAEHLKEVLNGKGQFHQLNPPALGEKLVRYIQATVHEIKRDLEHSETYPWSHLDEQNKNLLQGIVAPDHSARRILQFGRPDSEGDLPTYAKAKDGVDYQNPKYQDLLAQQYAALSNPEHFRDAKLMKDQDLLADLQNRDHTDYPHPFSKKALEEFQLQIDAAYKANTDDAWRNLGHKPSWLLLHSLDALDTSTQELRETDHPTEEMFLRHAADREWLQFLTQGRSDDNIEAGLEAREALALATDPARVHQMLQDRLAYRNGNTEDNTAAMPMSDAIAGMLHREIVEWNTIPNLNWEMDRLEQAAHHGSSANCTYNMTHIGQLAQRLLDPTREQLKQPMVDMTIERELTQEEGREMHRDLTDINDLVTLPAAWNTDALPELIQDYQENYANLDPGHPLHPAQLEAQQEAIGAFYQKWKTRPRTDYNPTPQEYLLESVAIGGLNDALGFGHGLQQFENPSEPLTAEKITDYVAKVEMFRLVTSGATPQ